MTAVAELATSVGVVAACEALAVPRASFYRWHKGPDSPADRSPRPSHRALTCQERQSILDVLHSDEFADKSPAEIYAALLDRGIYLGSLRTMYRILEETQEVRERRNQLRHPQYQKPELLATGPNQVWSWDITKLLGPAKWTYFYLYVILDIFSRYVVGWMLAHCESAQLAQRLIRESVDKQQLSPHQLTIHSDRGPAMKSQGVAQLLAALGITKSHSRPHVSNDNPFSESQFKTLKYAPEFPDRFQSYDHAREFSCTFFGWYNDDHYHFGLGLLTPTMVHYGQAHQIIARRQLVLQAAYAAHPERFVNKPPTPQPAPTQVWINPPSKPSPSELATPDQKNPFIETPDLPRPSDPKTGPQVSLLTSANDSGRLLIPPSFDLSLNKDLTQINTISEQEPILLPSFHSLTTEDALH